MKHALSNIHIQLHVAKQPGYGHKVTETCRWILMYDKAYFISVHLSVYYKSVNLQLNLCCLKVKGGPLSPGAWH